MSLFTSNIWLSVPTTCIGLVREFTEKREKSNNLQSQSTRASCLSRGIYKACMMTLSALGSHNTAGI